MSFKTLDDIINSDDLNLKNKSARIPIIFLIEATPEIKPNSLKNAIENLFFEINSNISMKSCADILIVQFNSGTTKIREFSLVKQGETLTIKTETVKDELDWWNPLRFTLKEIQKRKKEYDTLNINFYQPTILFLTSGNFDFNVNNESERICEIVEGMKNSGSLSIIPFCEKKNNCELLRHISVSGEVYSTLTSDFTGVFNELKKSLVSVSMSSTNAYKSLIDASQSWDDLVLR